MIFKHYGNFILLWIFVSFEELFMFCRHFFKSQNVCFFIPILRQNISILVWNHTLNLLQWMLFSLFTLVSVPVFCLIKILAFSQVTRFYWIILFLCKLKNSIQNKYAMWQRFLVWPFCFVSHNHKGLPKNQIKSRAISIVLLSIESTFRLCNIIAMLTCLNLFKVPHMSTWLFT